MLHDGLPGNVVTAVQPAGSLPCQPVQLGAEEKLLPSGGAVEERHAARSRPRLPELPGPLQDRVEGVHTHPAPHQQQAVGALQPAGWVVEITTKPGTKFKCCLCEMFYIT